ncbi:MAG: Mur ligase family protein, partial [Ezakiella massiliensis]
MHLSKIFNRLNIDENYDFDIKKIETNTKNCDNHTLFVAIKGTRVDTHEEKYLMEAYNNGARAFIVEREVAMPKDAVVFVVENSRKTLGLVSSTFFGHPSKTLRVIGVTGTKGKTSVAFIIKEIIEKYGFKCGIVGTRGIFYGDKHIKTNNTTPDPFTLQKAMREAVDAGVQYMVIEVSSQAMKQSRVFGTRFMANIFTNLSPDHIGPLEHENFEEYNEKYKVQRNEI